MYSNYTKYILLVLIVFFSCDDIDRDNIFDPKNPASERPQIITVEAFVNTNPSAPHSLNDTMLLSLDQIEDEYANRIIVLDYHRNVTNYTDPYYENKNENLYNIYTGGIGKGVPDVFINGIEFRIQGASTIKNSLFRLDEVLEPISINISYFTIEPTVTESNNQINVSVKLARLGTTNSEDIIVRVVVIYRIDNNLLKRVVHGIGKSTIISQISNGEIKEISVNPIDKPNFQYIDGSVIIMVTSDDEKSIYQSIKVDIP